MVQLPRATWQRRKIQEGSKGPMIVELAFVRVKPVRQELPGARGWAIFRRTLGSQPETKFYLSNAPADCSKQELTHITGMRWPVETALEEGKGEVGLDHFETLTWQGWHRHMLQSFLAHLFLMHFGEYPVRRASCFDIVGPENIYRGDFVSIIITALTVSRTSIIPHFSCDCVMEFFDK